LPASDAGVAALVSAVRTQPRPVVLIDGRSGSGKTTLATALVAQWPDAQLVRLDDLYPGWDGLDAGSAQVADSILAPVDPGWRAWDWASGGPGSWHPIDPHRPVVVEGAGSLSRRNRALATFGVWVELDASTRKRRALDRDGETYAPHWDRWAAQEDAFIAREHPRVLADVVIDERDPPAP